MRFFIGGGLLLLSAAIGFFFLKPTTVVITPGGSPQATITSLFLPPLPEAPEPSSSPISVGSSVSDITDQSPLSNPPKIINGIYLTAWSAGSAAKVSQTISFMKEKGLNAVVIDLKDYSGYVSYAVDVPEIKESGAENQLRILRPNALIKEFHDNGIYLIGRITVFQDPILAKAHPEWALKNKLTGEVWKDRRGLAWMDPAAQPVWDYNVAIAKDALARGFDEINFDYVRFASDGDLSQIGYPFWNEKTPRSVIIGDFFKYLRRNLPGATISADLFGLSTVDYWNDLGIGQVIENAYQYFNYVSPMVYPSHYAPGTLGYKNPADYPYQIISYSLTSALRRLKIYDSSSSGSSSTEGTSTELLQPDLATTGQKAKLRPWLQAFDLGAVYNNAMIQREVRAVDDVLGNASATAYFGGYLFWDAANDYSGLKN